MLKKFSMKNMNISKKLKFGYGLLLGITIVVSLLAVIGISLLDQSFANLVSGTAAANDAIKNCQIDINIAARDVREMALSRNESESKSYQTAIQDKLTDVGVQLAILEEGNVLSKEAYTAYEDAVTKWATDAYNIADIIEAGDLETGTQMIFENCIPALENLEEMTDTMDAEIQTMYGQAITKSRSIFYGSVILVVIVTILAIACSVIVGNNILKSIADPLVEIQACAKELSHGNLHTELTYESSDELGALAHSLRSSIRTLSSYVDDISHTMEKFAEGDFTVHPTVEWKGDFVGILDAFNMFEKHMSDTVVGIQQVAQQVENGSQQVSATSMELAQGATDQATVMQQFTSTLTDVSSQVAENADYAENISKNVEKVGVEISSTTEKMNEMVRSMNEIEESSMKIRQIIDTINDVASQTNLLALNASIEAARAGEFGRGFAVVANQVTALANQSATAAKESTQLIESSIKEVENGKLLTEEIAKQQESVATNAQTIVEEVENVAKTLKSQNDSFNQLNEGILQINDVIQTNSATSEECAASSQEMSGQASVLDDLVRGFKVANA